MRRTATLLAAVLTVAGVFAVVEGRSSGRNTFTVDAIFDTAKGIVPGHVVKIAGVRAGTVDDVSLTARRQARIRMTIDGKYAPFRADASCRILPEGLISENFVQCATGRSARPLTAGRDDVATVSVEHTAVPVDLQDVINIFTLPVDQRARAIISELGLATAGRGADLNAILRRANPALDQTRNALGMIAAQDASLRDAITQSDTVLAKLATRRSALRQFVTQANTAAGTTAAHAGRLGEAVRRLPPLLEEVQPTLGAVKRLAQTGTPLLRELRVAAPSLQTFTRKLVPFSDAGVPAVDALGAVTAARRHDVRTATPTLAHLRRLTTTLGPQARQVALLFDSLTKQGGIEALMKFTYQMAAMSGAYDSTSHYVGVVINLWINCLLNLESKGCSQAYSAPGNGTIPANAPSLGPQRLGTKVDPGSALITPGKAARMARAHPERIKALLDYLLK